MIRYIFIAIFLTGCSPVTKTETTASEPLPHELKPLLVDHASEPFPNPPLAPEQPPVPRDIIQPAVITFRPRQEESANPPTVAEGGQPMAEASPYCGLDVYLLIMGASVMAVILGYFASRRFMMPLILALTGLLFVACSAPVFIPGFVLDNGYKVSLEPPPRPVPPAPANYSAVMLILGLAAIAVAGLIYWRKKP